MKKNEKEKIRILLIQFYSVLQPNNSEPLSIEVLAAAIYSKFSNDIEISYLLIEETSIQRSLENLDFSYDLLCASIPQGTYALAKAALDKMKKEWVYEPLIILGHAIPASAPELFLVHYPNAICVNSWGEETIVKIIEAYKKKEIMDNIPNITCVKNGKIFKTPVIWPEEIIIPERTLMRDFFYRIEASRGCTYNSCSFCSRPQTNGKRIYQKASLSNVKKQLLWFSEHQISNFTFTDEDFYGGDYLRVIELTKIISECGNFNFSLSLRPDNVFSKNNFTDNPIKAEMLMKLKDSGLQLIFLGVESLSQSQLDRYNKGTKIEEILEAIKIIQKLNIELEVALILFDPLLKKDELRENVHTINKYSLWAQSAQLFNHLRIQLDAPISRSREISKLLTEFNNETLDYSYKFIDKDVSNIFTFCVEWKNRIDDLYLLIRNEVRTGDELSKFLAKLILTRYRYLQNELLVDVIDREFTLDKDFTKDVFKKQKRLIKDFITDPQFEPLKKKEEIQCAIRQLKQKGIV